MRQRVLAATIGAATYLVAAAALAQSASQAVQQFGLVGTWSPNCAGEFRVTYATPPSAAPTVRVTMRGTEIAASEIQQILALTPTRISWRSLIKAWSLPDQPPERWMPQPGEIWETTLAKTADQIRPLTAQRLDGQKVSVRDGFIYTGEPVGDTGTIVWRSTGEETLPLAKCPAGHGTADDGTAGDGGALVSVDAARSIDR